MAVMGRPKKQINKEEFEKLCGLQCTLDEVCGWFEVEDDTLNRWCKETYNGKTFSEIFKVKRSKGKIALRRHQFQLAENNASMAIFLGKQYLGQKDTIAVENEELTKVDKLLKKIEEEVVNDTNK